MSVQTTGGRLSRGTRNRAHRPRTWITATRTIEADIETVFAFLSDRESHEKLTGRKIQLLKLSDDGNGTWQALMQIRGPLGLKRHALARTELSEWPTLIEGSGCTGRRTKVKVRWELYRAPREETVVVLFAAVRSLDVLDWILLHAGGRGWVRRLFRATLELLANEVEAPGVVELSHRRPPVLRRPAT